MSVSAQHLCSLLALEAEARLIKLTLCIYLLAFLFYFHNTFESAGLFCQDEDDL